MANQVNVSIASIQAKLESGKRSIESNLEIAKLEKDIQRHQDLKIARIFEIGDIVHKSMRDGSRTIPDNALNLHNAIFAIDMQIKEQRDQIIAIRNSLNKEGSLCHSCGKPSPISSNFCVHCGVPALVETKSPKCIRCCSAMIGFDEYCSQCGSKVR